MAVMAVPRFYFPTMATVTANDYLRNLRFVVDRVPTEVNRIVYKNEVEIIELNTEDQLFTRSVNIFGNPLGYYASDHAMEAGDVARGYPKLFNQPYNFLKTGALYRDMYLRLNGDALFIENSDSGNKLGDLYFLTRAEFIGLTTENKAVVNWGIIYPELMEFINKYV